jgi:hypothetical protein
MTKEQRADHAAPEVWQYSHPHDMPSFDDALDVVSRELGAESIPSCKHGPRIRKEGHSSKTNKPYAGWVCSSKNRQEQCEAIWN